MEVIRFFFSWSQFFKKTSEIWCFLVCVCLLCVLGCKCTLYHNPLREYNDLLVSVILS